MACLIAGVLFVAATSHAAGAQATANPPAQKPPAQKPPAQKAPPQQQAAPKQPTTYTKRDSARITIFETPVPATPLRAPYIVDTAAVLKLGASTAPGDSLSLINQAVDVTVLKSGTIAVADEFDTRIKFFSRYGAFTTAAGGRGSDSGMFTALKSVDARGDTLVACCSPGVSLFSASGKFLSATPPFRSEFLGVMPSGRYLVRNTTNETSAFQGQKGVVKSLLTDTLFFVDSRGTFSGRVVSLPSRIHVGVFNPDPNPLGLSITFLETPFEPESYYAMARTGFYYTDGRNIEARLYTSAGVLTRIIRLQKPAPALTAALVDQFKQAVLRKYTVVETRRYIEWVLSQYTAPQSLPMVRALRVAADGRIWLREHAFPATADATWHIFNAEGAYEGALQLPSKWTVHHIENEFVVVSEVGANGRSLVTVHKLTKG